MMMVVLFALLLWCLAGFREGVWTKYTPQDVARWHLPAEAALAAGTAEAARSQATPGRRPRNETRRPRPRTAEPAQVNTGRKKLRS